MAVSELYLYDIDTVSVAEALYENEPLHRLKLLGKALDALTVDESGRIAWIEVPRSVLDQTGASDEDTEGLVNYARSLQGVQVGVIFRETADGRIRVGLRSRRGVDVSSIAGDFGGGGHPRASGCTVDGPLEAARERILQALKRAVAELADPCQ
jgi:phosphoesterase RecJ-like protein